MYRLQLKTLLLFLVVLIIAFLPVSSFLFFLKNDAFTGYFPPKFFMSESIAAGHLPIWNPYINFGFPQYGDMSAGYWSPITWLIASTTGYNAYTFTVEVLLYILLSGMGMYIFCTALGCRRMVCIVAGISYMCCGYQTGHLQHFNWLSGAAFLPWAMWAYMRLVNAYSFRTLLTAILFFYLFISSAHPGLIIAGIYFFIAFGVFLFVQILQKEKFKPAARKFFISHTFLLILLLLLSIGMVVGYTDIFPWMTRGEKIALYESLLTPTSLPSWVSLILPFATIKNDSFFLTDISMRNCYIGLLAFSLLIVSLIGKKTPLQKFLFVAGILFALLALGGIFKTISYNFLPFIGYVRLNGEFRIFSLMCFIIIAAVQLEKLITENIYIKLNLVLKILCAAVTMLFLWAIIAALVTKESLLYSIFFQRGEINFPMNIKGILDNISFYDTIILQAPIQILLLFLLIKNFAKENLKSVLWLVIADLIIATLMNVPFTGVGNTSVAQLQKVINTSPKGLPIPALIQLKNIGTEPGKTALLGDWSMYSKNIGSTSQILYPIVLTSAQNYFTRYHAEQNYLLHKPYAFLRKSSDNLQVLSFSGNSFSFKANINSPDSIILLQNWYPHWKDQNGKQVRSWKRFVEIPIGVNEQKASATFRPTIVLYAMSASLIFFILLILMLIFYRPKFPSLS